MAKVSPVMKERITREEEANQRRQERLQAAELQREAIAKEFSDKAGITPPLSWKQLQTLRAIYQLVGEDGIGEVLRYEIAEEMDVEAAIARELIKELLEYRTELGAPIVTNKLIKYGGNKDKFLTIFRINPRVLESLRGR